MKNWSLLVLLFLSISAGSPANAADSEWECSVWATQVSQSVFTNSGIAATSGPAVLAVPECAKGGVYGNLFLAIPEKDFDNGKEVDARVGRRFAVHDTNVDASIAYYYFGIGTERYDVVNSQLRLSRTFAVRDETSLQLFAVADWKYDVGQNPLGDQKSSLGLAGGLEFTTQTSFDGRPTFSANLQSWRYSTIFAPNRGPVTTLSLRMTYQLGEVFLGPSVQHTRGSVINDGEHTKNVFGVFAVVPF